MNRGMSIVLTIAAISVLNLVHACSSNDRSPSAHGRASKKETPTSVPARAAVVQNPK